jgi:hypothetical protein
MCEKVKRATEKLLHQIYARRLYYSVGKYLFEEKNIDCSFAHRKTVSMD